MATVSAIFITNKEQKTKQPPGEDLHKIAEKYIEEQGGPSLGELDTPSFIRKLSNVSLKPHKGLLKREMAITPDEKILKFLNVLRKNELPLVG